ncbi:MAG TPA: histidine kinase dimerization/phosphoacceptor domain -containing protein [Sphingomicrobium sp.]|jgi:two-component sensor histidine kinase|nr:histidine kinase dimerization/phosphoacceptor domain -containing protein [Sphingomicrobium sp.]
MSEVTRWFQRLPTTGKLLVILSAAVLPLGLVLVWVAAQGIGTANSALIASAENQSMSAMRSVDGLIARHALALRIAANASLRTREENPCEVTRRALSVTGNAPRNFDLRDASGNSLCTVGSISTDRAALLVAPGAVRLWLSPGGSTLYYRVGILNGMATGTLTREELRESATAALGDVAGMSLSDGSQTMRLNDSPQLASGFHQSIERERPIAGGQLRARTTVLTDQVAVMDRGLILLPLLMWIVAAILSWFLVSRFLIKPLRRMQRAVGAYQPGSGQLELPVELGSAVEIRDLGQSFSRAVERIEESELEMAEALEGQRKLVREVHHRVKNNLQVVASLLNIHGRNAESQDARDAYSSIGRRVDALAVVHRNHYAELEENRGIALRPLLSELAASLRGSAPDSARGLNIDLDLESLNTTQDVAVAIAFLVTEVVEFAMLARPDEPVELTLRRNGDLTARFGLGSPVLNPEAAEDPERKQFERIIGGLAKQLRSSLERKLGRYSVDLPVFPPR